MCVMRERVLRLAWVRDSDEGASAPHTLAASFLRSCCPIADVSSAPQSNHLHEQWAHCRAGQHRRKAEADGESGLRARLSAGMLLCYSLRAGKEI